MQVLKLPKGFWGALGWRSRVQAPNCSGDVSFPSQLGSSSYVFLFLEVWCQSMRPWDTMPFLLISPSTREVYIFHKKIELAPEEFRKAGVHLLSGANESLSSRGGTQKHVREQSKSDLSPFSGSVIIGLSRLINLCQGCPPQVPVVGRAFFQRNDILL